MTLFDSIHALFIRRFYIVIMDRHSYRQYFSLLYCDTFVTL